MPHKGDCRFLYVFLEYMLLFGDAEYFLRSENEALCVHIHKRKIGKDSVRGGGGAGKMKLKVKKEE